MIDSLKISIDYVVPILALIVSGVAAYSNSRHRSIDLAIKYSDYLTKTEGIEPESPTLFNQIVRTEASRAKVFFVWKSFAHVTNHKRTKLNYSIFFIFVFGWLGMGLETAVNTAIDTGALPALYLFGLIAVLLSSALLMYTRYEATLYDKYLLLLEEKKYQPSYAAVYQAEEKVVQESVLPIFLSLIIGLLGAHFFDSAIVWPAWIMIVAALLLIDGILSTRAIKNETKAKKV